MVVDNQVGSTISEMSPFHFAIHVVCSWQPSDKVEAKNEENAQTECGMNVNVKRLAISMST